MDLLSGKKALIFGVANERSIAWGIAQAFHQHGASLGFSYVAPMERFIRPLAAHLDVRFLEQCDVAKDDEIAALAKKARAHFGQIDILVHSVAYAGREELSGPYYKTSRDGFRVAMDISVYSFVALAHAFQPLIAPGGSLLCMTYYGAEKVVPGYNVMGVAKAALEASTRYLAHDFGPQDVRVNAISAGPIRTLASAGVGGFKGLYKQFADMAPLRQNISIEDVGNAAIFLCSDLSARVTGEVLYVDGGYNIMGVPEIPTTPKERGQEGHEETPSS